MFLATFIRMQGKALMEIFIFFPRVAHRELKRGGEGVRGWSLTVKHISKTSRPKLYFQLKCVSADLPGIMTQAHSVRDVVHTHAR